MRFQTNREYLARAIRLGFREIEVVDPNSPIVCRTGHRAYAWQPLDADSAIGPTDDATRIESHTQPSEREFGKLGSLRSLNPCFL